MSFGFFNYKLNKKLVKMVLWEFNFNFGFTDLMCNFLRLLIILCFFLSVKSEFLWELNLQIWKKEIFH